LIIFFRACLIFLAHYRLFSFLKMARPGFRLSFQFSLNGRCSIEMVVARYLTNMIAGFTRLCEQAKTLEAAASSQQGGHHHRVWRRRQPNPRSTEEGYFSLCLNY
jgi:hypothetical protein